MYQASASLLGNERIRWNRPYAVRKSSGSQSASRLQEQFEWADAKCHLPAQSGVPCR